MDTRGKSAEKKERKERREAVRGLKRRSNKRFRSERRKFR